MSSETLLRERTRLDIENCHIENYSRCFLCNEPTGLYFVYWHGCTADIALCEDCAMYLGEHLLKDSISLRNIKLFYGGVSNVSKR